MPPTSKTITSRIARSIVSVRAIIGREGNKTDENSAQFCFRAGRSHCCPYIPLWESSLVTMSHSKFNAVSRTPWSAVRRFLNNTTAHGLPRIPHARNQGGKFFWISVWFSFFTVFLVQALILVSKYCDRHPATVVTVSLSSFDSPSL
ncbi:hypothetical protein Y032_0015g2758 [Ancylostoma ceylanicum]|uniref:Uncharacterized protein n=1 Tax=Ancylostoma ceylanicum TaxID=53326 RepID=A0A016V9G4_9BILA|nr:hypothetical protein Y032_0015g2758 [Ancylostoma ceylanicum]